MDPFYYHHVGHNVINTNYNCEISTPQWCHQSKLGANDPSFHHDQLSIWSAIKHELLPP